MDTFNSFGYIVSRTQQISKKKTNVSQTSAPPSMISITGFLLHVNLIGVLWRFCHFKIRLKIIRIIYCLNLLMNFSTYHGCHVWRVLNLVVDWQLVGRCKEVSLLTMKRVAAGPSLPKKSSDFKFNQMSIKWTWIKRIHYSIPAMKCQF